MCALDLLVQRSPKQRIWNPVTNTHHDFKMNFITLTIAHNRNLEMQEAYKKLLAPWLRYMRSKMGMTDYVWKGEYQKRGQVHYHLATNCYIPWSSVRWQWNTVQRRAGLLNEFARKYKHFNPPSTDIHSMVKVDDCLSYISKEMCKGMQNKIQTKGKIWDCNLELKRGRYSDMLTTDMEMLLDDALQHGFAEKIESDHCIILKTKNPLLFLNDRQKKDYFNHVKN